MEGDEELLTGDIAADGFPASSFAVEDVAAEYERLQSLGVRFMQAPVDHGTVIAAVLDDTCGDRIQISQEKLES